MKQKIPVQIITACPECGKRVVWKGFADQRPACPRCGATLAELPAYDRPVDVGDPMLYRQGTRTEVPLQDTEAAWPEKDGEAQSTWEQKPLIKRKNPWVPIFWVLGSLLAAGAAYFFAFGRHDLERKKLLHEGLPAEAVILSVEQTGNWSNRQPQVRIEMEIHADGRAPWRASTVMVVPLTALVQLQPGSRWRVRYDPERPERVTLE